MYMTCTTAAAVIGDGQAAFHDRVPPWHDPF